VRGETIQLSPRDWLIITSIPCSLDISKLARRVNLPQSTVSRRLKSLSTQISISFCTSKKAVGLKPTILFFTKPPYRLPAYTVSARTALVDCNEWYMVSGLIPETYVNEYIELFVYQPLFKFIGEEKLFWRPDIALELGVINITHEGLKVNYYKLSKVDYKWNMPDRRHIDKYDMQIMFFKEKYAFTPLTEILQKINRSNSSSVTIQALSYHFRKHVLPLWIGNSVKPYRKVSDYPLRLHVFECFDAEDLALKLALVPHIYSIYCSKDGVAFTSQLSVKEMFMLTKTVLKKYKAKPVYKEIFLESSFRKYLIKYHELWDKDWLKPFVAKKAVVYRV